VVVAALRIRADVDAFDAWKQAKDDKQAQKTVSIIIPVLNEEANLAELFVHLSTLDPQPLQVIFVDGGSTDRHVPCLFCSAVHFIKPILNCASCLRRQTVTVYEQLNTRKEGRYHSICALLLIACAALADCSHSAWCSDVSGCQTDLF
jgi:hypothetical protein